MLISHANFDFFIRCHLKLSGTGPDGPQTFKTSDISAQFDSIEEKVTCRRINENLSAKQCMISMSVWHFPVGAYLFGALWYVHIRVNNSACYGIRRVRTCRCDHSNPIVNIVALIFQVQ